MKKTILLFFWLLFFMLSSVVVVGGPFGSFDYYIQGQTIIATPCLSDVTYYKWKLKGDYDTETEWIPISDIDSHKFIVNWSTKYRITLVYKNGSNTGEFHRIVGIGNDPDPPDTEEEEEITVTTQKYSNVFDKIPSNVKNWFKERSFFDLLLIFFVVIVLFLYFLQRKKKKKFYLPIKKG